jgi:hypothetical protein
MWDINIIIVFLELNIHLASNYASLETNSRSIEILKCFYKLIKLHQVMLSYVCARLCCAYVEFMNYIPVYIPDKI